MPSFSSFIAKKYFFSLGKLGAIRLMSLAALVGLALGTAAMTVVLSAFAGLEDLILTQFEDANATLKIESATGPYVELTSEDSLFLSGLEANFEETSTWRSMRNACCSPTGKTNTSLTYWAYQKSTQKGTICPSTCSPWQTQEWTMELTH